MWDYDRTFGNSLRNQEAATFHAKNEYKSYILIDFNRAEDEVKDLFLHYLNDLDSLFMYLSGFYNVKLYEHESLIIFDEVQMFPRARAAIKYLSKKM